MISSCGYGIMKPAKELFQVALKHFNASPRQCLFIGNKISTDMKGAENAGFRGLLFDPEDKHIEEYQPGFHSYLDLICE